MTRKTKTQLDREIAQLIAGDAELEGRHEEAKAIRKQGKVPRTGARGGALLGYTASGKPIHAPARHGAPNTNDIVVFRKTKAKFPGWSKADHMDASFLLEEAAKLAAQDGDRKLERTLSRWAGVHWAIGGGWTGPEFEARFACQGGH